METSLDHAPLGCELSEHQHDERTKVVLKP
jgi:hypothetical protein